MTEKSEEQVAKEKAAVDSLRNVRANMATAFERIETLERALRTAIDHMNEHLKWVSPSVYGFEGGSGNGKSCQSIIRDHIAAAAKVVGPLTPPQT